MTIDALMIGSSPLRAVKTGTSAVVDMLTAEKPAAGQELSPAEMLVQKTTSVMESLWSGQGLLRERWYCAQGWWMMAVLTGSLQEIHGTSSYYRVVFVPNIIGILS